MGTLPLKPMDHCIGTFLAKMIVGVLEVFTIRRLCMPCTFELESAMAMVSLANLQVPIGWYPVLCLSSG